MTAELEAAPAPEAVILERGRYAIEQEPDGSWFLLRAGPICERCQSCGCGEQQEPIHVAKMIVNLITMSPEDRAKVNPLAMMKRLIGNG